MKDLPDECVPCHRGGIEPLAEPDAEALRSEHTPGWTLDFPRIRRSYELADFRAALDWVNAVGEVAEQADHHPDIHLTNWNRVELVLWTHAIGGLHPNDFVVARRLDARWADREDRAVDR